MLKYSGKWRLDAKCMNDKVLQALLDTGVNPFFDKPEAANKKWAKQYCKDCPVRLACLAEAMSSLEGSHQNHLQGIWGGMTYRNRLALWKKQRKEIQAISERMKELFPDTEDPIAS